MMNFIEHNVNALLIASFGERLSFDQLVPDFLPPIPETGPVRKNNAHGTDEYDLAEAEETKVCSKGGSI